MKKSYQKILVAISVFLLASTIILGILYIETKNNQSTIRNKIYDSESIESNLSYVLRMQLRVDSWAFDRIIMNITDSHHNISQDEIHGYIEGYREFMDPNAFGMIEGMILWDDTSLRNLFSELRKSIIYAEDIWGNTPESKKDEVVEAYINLRDLLDENKTTGAENSLWYYILRNEDESKKEKIIKEIQTNIDTLKQFADRWHTITDFEY